MKLQEALKREWILGWLWLLSMNWCPSELFPRTPGWQYSSLPGKWLSKRFQLYLCIINRNMSWGIVPTVLSNIGSRIIVSTKICIALLYYPPWWSPWWLVDILIIYPSWCMVTVRLHVRCLLCCHEVTIIQWSVFYPVQQSSRRLKVLSKSNCFLWLQINNGWRHHLTANTSSEW